MGMSRLKVYYNSACPVCDAGIKYQQRRMPGEKVEWIDIHRYPQALHEIGASQEFVRERLHLLDADGQLRIGADAFRALWSRTPGQTTLAGALGLPIIGTIARWGYNAFAAALYAWNRRRGRW